MADYPNAYTIFSFVETCNSVDVVVEIENLKDRVEDLEDIVNNPQDVYI